MLIFENDWDVIGDYRWVNPWLYTPSLKVEGEFVRGFIRGLSDAPPECNLNEITYALFREELVSSGDCDNITASTEAAASLVEDIIIPNPFSDYLEVKLREGLSCDYLRLYSLQGQLLREKGWTKTIIAQR